MKKVTLGLSTHYKIMTTLCMLCHGMCANVTNEYCKTSDVKIIESLKWFCMVVRVEFEALGIEKVRNLSFSKSLQIGDCTHRMHFLVCPV